MNILKTQKLKLNVKRTFLSKGACSNTFFYILNNEFGYPKAMEERALDPLAGGIVQMGYQCGMLWGASMAVGAESYRRNDNKCEATAMAIIATQHVMESYKNLTGTCDCADVTDTDKLHDVLRDLAAQVARTTRREQLAGRVITLKVRYQGFDTYTRQSSIEKATGDERVLLDTAWALFSKGDLPDKAVRLIGIGISGWEEAEQGQADMFESAETNETDQKILETIDKLTDKYGKALLQIGVSKQKS